MAKVNLHEKKARKKLKWKLAKRWLDKANEHSILWNKDDLGPGVVIMQVVLEIDNDEKLSVQPSSKNGKITNQIDHLRFYIFISERDLYGLHNYLYPFDPFLKRLDRKLPKIPLEKVDSWMEFIPLYILEKDEIEYGMTCYAHSKAINNKGLVHIETKTLSGKNRSFVIYRREPPPKNQVEEIARSVLMKRFADLEKNPPDKAVFIPILYPLNGHKDKFSYCPRQNDP